MHVHLPVFLFGELIKKAGASPLLEFPRDAYFVAGAAVADVLESALAAFLDFLVFLVFLAFFSTTAVSVEGAGAGACAAALNATAANIAATRADRILFITSSF